MSFLGSVEAKCPKGCEPANVQIWSFVNGSKDSALRETLLAGDLNLVSCEQCGTIFYPEATVIYYDAPAKLVAFVFPESYQKEEARWRLKMDEDYKQMRDIIHEKNITDLKPALYFGMEALRRQLQAEDDLEDEVNIAKLLAAELKISLYAVDRTFARSDNLPWLLPYRGGISVASALAGLETLLKKNPHLKDYQRWQKLLSASDKLPPGTF